MQARNKIHIPRIKRNVSQARSIRYQEGEYDILVLRISASELAWLRSDRNFCRPALYLRISTLKNEVYVGMTSGKDGVVQRSKEHNERESMWSSPRAPAEDVILFIDQSGQLDLEELRALEAALIRFVAENVSMRLTNKNWQAIVYTSIRETHILKIFETMTSLLPALGIPLKAERAPVLVPTTVRASVLTDVDGNEYQNYCYLSDKYTKEDTAVIAENPFKFSTRDAASPDGLTLRLPITRHRIVRFVAFYQTEQQCVTHFAKIATKHPLIKDASSVTYRLHFDSPPISIDPVRLSNPAALKRGHPRHVLLKSLLSCSDAGA